MNLPALSQFRVERHANGLIHLVFDCPGKSMNVFSNKAIHELGAFAEWLHHGSDSADVRGVVLRSGKPTGFCAGADLTELGVAYDMIVAAPAADRFDIAFNHFFPLSHAIRRLETAGKPVAAAIAGVALGGGCELTLGAHYRVATTSPRAILGLPECAVGLLPGAGGTQRMPRLVGIDIGLEVLLLGRTLQGQAALETGLIHALVEEGQEVAAAEAWLLSDAAHARQPWDSPHVQPLSHAEIGATIAAHRTRELKRMLGHEPAPLAILDCAELGLIQPLDGAIRSEMAGFAQLIQRAETRNMIRTLFLGKQAYDRANRDGSLSACVTVATQAIFESIVRARDECPELSLAGFGEIATALIPPRDRTKVGFWLQTQAALLDALHPVVLAGAEQVIGLTDLELLQLDHAVVREGAIPAYLGGITGLIKLVSAY